MIYSLILLRFSFTLLSTRHAGPVIWSACMTVLTRGVAGAGSDDSSLARCRFIDYYETRQCDPLSGRTIGDSRSQEYMGDVFDIYSIPLMNSATHRTYIPTPF